MNGKLDEWEKERAELRGAVAAEEKAKETEIDGQSKAWIWGEWKRELEVSLDNEKNRADSAEASLQDKSEAWKQSKESLRAELSSASDKSSSQEATIVDLERQLGEVTIEKDALIANSNEMRRTLETSVAKSGLMATHRRKLQKRKYL